MSRHETPEEIARRGEAVYERLIRPRLGAPDRGKFLVINVDTGEYELDTDDLAASKRAKARFPNAPLFTMRVGRPAAYRLGGRFAVNEP
jgi:hypothetical protein